MLQLDYIFRNETLIQEIESELFIQYFSVVFSPLLSLLHFLLSSPPIEEPKGTIIFNEFLLPLPRVSKRDVAVMKLWIPEYLTHNGLSGDLEGL